MQISTTVPLAVPALTSWLISTPVIPQLLVWLHAVLHNSLFGHCPLTPLPHFVLPAFFTTQSEFLQCLNSIRGEYRSWQPEWGQGQSLSTCASRINSQPYRSWRDGSAGQVVALQAWGLGFVPQNPCKKNQAPGGNASFEEAETGESLQLIGQQGAREPRRSYPQARWRVIEEVYQPLANTCVHLCKRKHTHTLEKNTSFNNIPGVLYISSSVKRLEMENLQIKTN